MVSGGSLAEKQIVFLFCMEHRGMLAMFLMYSQFTARNREAKHCLQIQERAPSESSKILWGLWQTWMFLGSDWHRKGSLKVGIWSLCDKAVNVGYQIPSNRHCQHVKQWRKKIIGCQIQRSNIQPDASCLWGKRLSFNQLYNGSFLFQQYLIKNTWSQFIGNNFLLRKGMLREESFYLAINRYQIPISNTDFSNRIHMKASSIFKHTHARGVVDKSDRLGLRIFGFESQLCHRNPQGWKWRMEQLQPLLK